MRSKTLLVVYSAGISWIEVKHMKIETAAVVGSGIMGAQIAQVLATAGHTVWLHDVRTEALDSGVQEIEHGRFGLRASVARGKISEESAKAALRRIRVTLDINEACEDVDLIIEAVPEILDLKMEIFRSLNGLARQDAILASNTAGLSVTALAHATTRPSFVLGWHWATPCAVMRMAEIVRHSENSQEMIEAVVQAARRCGKNPIVINDQPLAWGFVANRIMLQVRREAFRVVNEGVATKEQVDQLMKDCFRWPLGPFEGMGDIEGFLHRPEGVLLR
jgi:3-hydroxyacyl-CoA dehydrogenase